MKAKLATKATETLNAADGGYAPGAAVERPEIIDGPDAVFTSRECDTFRWRVRHARGEQSVYVEIGWALVPEVLEEPLRSAVESKGEAPLLELLAEGPIPLRIRITGAGVFVVHADGPDGLI